MKTIIFFIIGVLCTSCSIITPVKYAPPTSLQSPIAPHISSGNITSGVVSEFRSPFSVFGEIKTVSGFLTVYHTQQMLLESVISSGSGATVFDYPVIDKILPYIKVCQATRSGDVLIVRQEMRKYRSIIPLLHSSGSSIMLDQFLQGHVSLQDIYTTLMNDPELPLYFHDLVTGRLGSIGIISKDTCEDDLKKYETLFFSRI